MMFVAVDFGNTRTKFGLFEKTDLLFVCTDVALLESRLPKEPLDWLFARTSGTLYEALRHWIGKHRPGDRVRELTWQDIPMPLAVDVPEQVGIDRLLAAYAAKVRVPDSPLLVVDAGSAMTVDVVTADGVFQGGAILPGFAAAADALARISPKLPLIDVAEISSTDYPGRNTVDALAAGIYWGAVGAIRQCYEMSGASTIVLTGGNGHALKRGLSLPPDAVIEIPELVLVGAALVRVAERRRIR